MNWRDFVAQTPRSGESAGPPRLNEGGFTNITYSTEGTKKTEFSLSSDESPQNSTDSLLSVKYAKPEKAMHKEPVPPVQPGWLIAYRDRNGLLCGGCDDREHGTVDRCEWSSTAWTVILTDGQRLPLVAVRGVAKTDLPGRILAAWETSRHGYDGEGRDRDGKEGCVPPSVADWRELWRDVAALTAGITADDVRAAGLLDALQACDEAFRLGDYAAFQAGALRVRQIVTGRMEE